MLEYVSKHCIWRGGGREYKTVSLQLSVSAPKTLGQDCRSFSCTLYNTTCTCTCTIVVSSQMKICTLLGSVILKVSSMVEKRKMTKNDVELGHESGKEIICIWHMCNLLYLFQFCVRNLRLGKDKLAAFLY